jgi:uncharacterized damage-inducible protein DinB
MPNPLAVIFRYNAWANRQVLAACLPLTDEQLDFPMRGGDRRSIRQKLLHIVGGQQTFVLRTMGRQHEGELNAGSPWPGFDRLAEIERSSSDDLISIVEAMTEDEQVVLPYMEQRPRFPKSFFLTHAFAHGAQHRTEIVIALEAMGLAAPDLDAWPYAEFAGYGKEAD